MAATLTVVKSIPIAQSEVRDELSILMDSSYATGGEAITTPAGGKYLRVDVQASAGYIPEYDAVNGKLKVFRGDNANAAAAPAVEVANAVDLSAVTFVGYGWRVT